jgi:hypothetical protein
MSNPDPLTPWNAEPAPAEPDPGEPAWEWWHELNDYTETNS